jgi:PAS domain S-box-containing protein
MTIGPDGRITDVNAATEHVTGYSREDLIGTDFSGYFTDPEEARAGYEQVFLEGFVRDYALELRHRDNHTTSVLYNASVYRDQAGQIIGVFAAARDITMRKRGEEALKKSVTEKDLLLKEIHHRVKNNLQIIIGLIQMQARTSSDAQMVQTLMELQQRIRVMALVHERLYRSHSFSEMDFGRYLKELTDSLLQVFGSPGIVLEVKVGSVFLEIETVITCGLIITEIVTNALKYAFPDPQPIQGDGKPPRVVYVEFTEGSSGYTLVVSDNGIGLPQGFDLSAVTSMGLHLVHLWSTYQLNGSIEVRTDPGATFVIHFPKRRSGR